MGAELLDYITPFVVPGARTGDLDDLCDKYGRVNAWWQHPRRLGYRGYPSFATCMSIPIMSCATAFRVIRKLEEGDIVNIDVTRQGLDGWHGDTSRMFLCR